MPNIRIVSNELNCLELSTYSSSAIFSFHQYTVGNNSSLNGLARTAKVRRRFGIGQGVPNDI